MEERGRQSIPAATQIYPPPRPSTVAPATSSSFLPLVWKYYRRLVENCCPLCSPGPIERLPSINRGQLACVCVACGWRGWRGTGPGRGGLSWDGTLGWVLEVRRCEKDEDLEAARGGGRCSRWRHAVAFPLRRRAMGGD